MKFQEEKIDEIIHWFQTNDCFDLSELFSKSKFLAAQTRPLSKEVGRVNKIYNHAHMMRRIIFINKRKHFIDTTKCSKAEAERLAEETKEFQEHFQNEYTYKAQYENGRAYLKSIENILSRMNQEIAELRQEKNAYVEDERMEAIIRKIDKRRDAYFPQNEIASQ